MNHRHHELMGLLAALHATASHGGAQRGAAVERLVSALGGVLKAGQTHLLHSGQRVPLLITRGRGEAVARETALADVSGWWDRWLTSFREMPADGAVRLGLVLPGKAGVLVSPPGWGEGADASEVAGDENARPLLAMGLLLDRRPLRVAFLREAGSLGFTGEDRSVLAGVGDHLGIHGRLGGRLDRLQRETVTDELTGLHNYRYLKRQLTGMLRRLDAKRSVLSVLMLDVDNLRAFNGRFGHLAASAALASVGRVLRESLDAEGWIAKYGGDEFLIVLPRAERDEALVQAHHLRGAVERAQVGLPSFDTLTCSLGVATAPSDGTTFADLLGAADRALFAAKAQGRNTVVVAGPGNQDSGPAQAA